MSGTIPAARQHLIDAIAKCSRKVAGASSPVSLADFVQQYYRGVGEEDLQFREPAHFAAAAARHLEFGLVRRAGAPLVRVFNPREDVDGWRSPNTIVEVVADDMPFLVDSLAMVLNDAGLAVQLMVHPVLRVTRDARGRLKRLEDPAGDAGKLESWQHLAVSRMSDPARLEALRVRILSTLEDVRLAVADWSTMRDRARQIGKEVLAGVPRIPRNEEIEAGEFIEWLADNHFTFLGYREYRLERGNKHDNLVPLPKSGFGLLRTGAGRPDGTATATSRPIHRRGASRRRTGSRP